MVDHARVRPGLVRRVGDVAVTAADVGADDGVLALDGFDGFPLLELDDDGGVGGGGIGDSVATTSEQEVDAARGYWKG